MPDFASLEPQDVREYWTHEERDFTPWIADQLDAEPASELENAIGLDIELIEREKPVGKYNVDIFAKAIGDERKIVIENQLARSEFVLNDGDDRIVFEERKNGPGEVTLMFGVGTLQQRIIDLDEPSWSGHITATTVNTDSNAWPNALV